MTKLINFNSFERKILEESSQLCSSVINMIENFIYSKIIEMTREGTQAEYTLRYDKKHGEYREIELDEVLTYKHCFYKNGELNGEYKIFDVYHEISYTYEGERIYVTEPILHCYYKNGILQGKYKEITYNDRDSVILIQCYYKDGILQGKYTNHLYNIDNCILKECYYEDGMLQGEYKKWFEDQREYIKCTYKDDKLEGIYYEWIYDEYDREICIQKTLYIEGEEYNFEDLYKDYCKLRDRV